MLPEAIKVHISLCFVFYPSLSFPPTADPASLLPGGFNEILFKAQQLRAQTEPLHISPWEPFPSQAPPLPAFRLTDTCYNRGWKQEVSSPKVFPTSTFRSCLSPARGGGWLFSVVKRRRGGLGGRKPFHGNRSKQRLPGHSGDRNGGPGGPRGPPHSRQFTPNFTTGGGNSAAAFLSLLPPLRGVGFNRCRCHRRG